MTIKLSFLASILCGALCFTVYAAQPGVTFPAIDQLQQYTTVTRGSTVEHMLITPDALKNIKDGSAVPVGTHLVLVDYQSGKLSRYLVSEKTGEGELDWSYQAFGADQKVNKDENPQQCYSCHESQQRKQFMFTFSDAIGFKR
ncbi:hypothetical protein ALO95_200272 [Pseudomonas syringae pv. antirrhini]|uniref:cytochrome P460 family protein n=1 Tax=Pseudomonas TaxID=286 RepID=UPI00070CADA4|nr:MULTISPECIES: cytochrome P460 family protein [Pseudomonas]RMP42492.1 hypothetical protein ALQ23_200391 [Pseudomonas syringae pv. antirrhini]RMW23444.1 hypothetical protein ALO95_200272 [Pseudomonas syringae pv. antirrhini]WIN08823.1 cytochrome P460 family protein [Pseudomonas syringae pv. antirrhini str. 126]